MRLLGYDLSVRGLSPRLETRSSLDISDLKDPLEWLLRFSMGSAQSATGIVVTPLKALGVASVFACVRILSTTISTLPLEIVQQKGRTRRKAPEHRLWRVLGKMPNRDMSSTDWRSAVQANLSLLATGYSEILRDSVNRAVGVYPIETSRMDCHRRYPAGDTGKNPIVYRLTDNNVNLKPEDVLHLKNNSFNGLIGINTTAAVREVIALALAMQDNAAKFFGNGSRPGGVLEHPLQLSKEAQDRLKDQFEEQTSGKNLYRLMVLEEGLKYNATRSENRDAQFVEARDAQTLEICRIFGVPPHKLGVTHGSPRANIEEENVAFVADIIRPLAVLWEQEMDRKLFSDTELDAGYCTYFNLDAMLRGNRKARYEAYAIGRQWGILSQNDCRVDDNLEEIAGGDTYLQPINMIDSTKATELQMKQATAGAKQKNKEGGTGGKPNANTP